MDSPPLTTADPPRPRRRGRLSGAYRLPGTRVYEPRAKTSDSYRRDGSVAARRLLHAGRTVTAGSAVSDAAAPMVGDELEQWLHGRSAEDAGQHHRAVRPARLRARVRAVDGGACAAPTDRGRDACARGRDDAGGLAAGRRAPSDLAAGALAEPPACGPVTGEAVDSAAAAHPVARAVFAAARELAVRPRRHRECVRAVGIRADARRVPGASVLRPRYLALPRRRGVGTRRADARRGASPDWRGDRRGRRGDGPRSGESRRQSGRARD